ncbi:MAG TPA: guanylate kinase [Lachnospiraceae bacterium]|nr:guanylate kinase [Lachnospiraceae bacterium]
MAREGILIVLSGFSGAGKGSIVKELIERYEQYALSISATTRAPRPGEEEGIAYFFKSREAFQQMIAEDALVEYAQYVDNYYGTPRAYVEEQLAKGKDVLLEIEIQGARKIKEQFPEAVLLFVTTKDIQTLEQRLAGRGTETKEVITQRLKRAVEESEGMEEYDYLVINDQLDTCVKQIHSIIESEHLKTRRNQAFVGKVREELKRFSKGE